MSLASLGAELQKIFSCTSVAVMCRTGDILVLMRNVYLRIDLPVQVQNFGFGYTIIATDYYPDYTSLARTV